MNESNNDDYNIDDDHDVYILYMHLFSWIKLQYNSKIINY